MTENYIKDEYFKWLSDKVCLEPEKYYCLLHKLHETEFYAKISRDWNRSDDGVSLRCKFGYEYNIDDHELNYWMEDEPCSLLEMMVALCIKCETQIMNDERYGDRTHIWFMCILNSLHLDKMTNDIYDNEFVEYMIDKCLERNYDKDGTGAIFKSSSRCNLESVEIWYQMCWYMNDVLKKENHGHEED